MGSVSSASGNGVSLRSMGADRDRTIRLLADEDRADSRNAVCFGNWDLFPPKTTEEAWIRSRLGELEDRVGTRLNPQSPEVFSSLIRSLGHCRMERLALLCLDQDGLYLGFHVVAEGLESRIDGTYRQVVECALLSGASSAVMVHNHPSGSAYPSAADKFVTRNLFALLRAIEVKLEDHIIVTRNEAYSLKMAGML